MITLRHTTLEGTPLGGGSARRRELCLKKQHSQERDINIAGGIQTRSLSKRAASDPCLRPRGHWDPIKPNYLKEFLFVCACTHPVNIWRFSDFDFILLKVTLMCTFKTYTK